MKYTASLVILLLTILFLQGQKVLQLEKILAFTMTNDNWKIDFSNINSTSGKPTGTNYKVSNTVGELSSGLYTGTNYKVRAGFQYVYSIIPFRFSISSLILDFGVLSPTNPVTRTNILTISNGSANGYAVSAYENHELLQPGTGSLIPDTGCDSGTCTQTASSAWTSNLVYGFGYRCDNLTGTDCATGFGTSTFYRQFANAAFSEDPYPVMTGTNVGRSKQVTITYKLNISGTQPPGEYTNQIIYLAVPTF
jgi:hypothetical protein